jgi:hypothetical protein
VFLAITTHNQDRVLVAEGTAVDLVSDAPSRDSA